MFEMADQSDLAQHAPAIAATWAWVESCLQQLHIAPVTDRIVTWLQEGNRFTDVTERVHKIPVGEEWHGTDVRLNEVGRFALRVLISWAGCVRPMLLDHSGQPMEAIDHMLASFVEEVQRVKNIYLVYHAIHARRV
jgi:hypothetical protein